jgi:CRP/FNR family transcriptional regulator, anaerobic regulatory protein
MSGTPGGRSAEKLLAGAFPFLQALPRKALEPLLDRAVTKSLAAGDVLVREGKECAYLPLVVEGALRVYKTSETGRELTLYRITRGESCVLTATCILSSGSFPAIAEAEKAVEVVLVPAPLLVRLVDEHAEWRRFVFGLYSKRLESVITLVEEVAFRRMDARLAGWLTAHAEGSPPVAAATHGGIAAELGTSREVVSRILEDFETRGIVETLRGKVRILDPGALHDAAGGSAAV